MARVATLAAEVTADIGPLKTQMSAAGRSVQDFTRRARTESHRFDDDMRRATRSSGAFGRGIQNAAFQVGDFAVQVGGGTSAVRAMSMQLPQLLGGFGVLGAVAGAAVAIIGPLAQKLFESSDAASQADSAISGLSGSLESMRGSIRQLTGLQETLNQLHRAQAGASAAGTSTVLANTEKEFNARRQLIEVERTLLRLRSQDAQIALRNLQEQQQAARDLAMERQRTLGPGATEGNGSGGFAGGGLRLGDIENTMLPSRLEEMRARSRDIQRLQAELALTEIAADEAAQSLDGVFQGSEATTGGAAGGTRGGGRSSSRVVQEVQAISQEMENLKDLTRGQLGEMLGAWSGYFNDLGSVMQSGNDKVLRIAKAFAAAEALINAYRAATQALADPTVPFWGKAAAYAQVLAAGLGAVNAIKGVNAGGGGGGASGVASGGGAGSRFSQSAVIQLMGSESATYSKSQVRDLINQINEAVEGGARIRLA